jgi:MFS family permease
MNIGIPGNWVMPAMSVGQFAEIGTMAVLGLFLKRLGWRWTMTIGILGHAMRFAVFALFPDPVLAVAVNVLHGVCYAFFFATVYIFVDEFFPKDVRSSAQGLFNLLILGLGPLVGNYIGPKLGTYFTIQASSGEPTVDFSRMFLIPSITALVAAIILAVAFHPPEKAVQQAP